MENISCSYGCGNVAANLLKNGKWCCGKSSSSCSNVKIKNSVGQHRSYQKGRKKYNYNSFSDETKLRMSRKGCVYMTVDEVFTEGKEWGSELLRKYIHYYNLLDYKCSTPVCGITDWHKEHLVLELDHIDGNRLNNKISNLRWLCPNCHSQTPTFRGYNKTLSGKKKVSDEELLTALKKCNNIRHALQNVGLAAKGGNYERAKKLLNKDAPVVEKVDTRDLDKFECL